MRSHDIMVLCVRALLTFPQEAQMNLILLLVTETYLKPIVSRINFIQWYKHYFEVFIFY